MKKYIGSLTRFRRESGKLFLCVFVLQKSRLSATLSLGLALFAGGGKRSFDYAKRAAERRDGVGRYERSTPIGRASGGYVNCGLFHNYFANLVANFHEIEAGGYCDRGVVGVDCAYHLTVGCVNLDSGL